MLYRINDEWLYAKSLMTASSEVSGGGGDESTRSGEVPINHTTMIDLSDYLQAQQRCPTQQITDFGLFVAMSSFDMSESNVLNFAKGMWSSLARNGITLTAKMK